MYVCMYVCMKMDDLQFYILFNSISVIAGQRVDDKEGYVQCRPIYIYEELGESKIQMQDFYLCMFICTYAYMFIYVLFICSYITCTI